MKWTLLLGACLLLIHAHAQVLLVEPGMRDPAEPCFNPEFMARNHVKSMKGQAWSKRDGRPMVPHERYFHYRFGAGGQLAYASTTFGRPGSGMDTASVMYSYDGRGHLLLELHHDALGHYALRMEYDDEGRAVRRTHVRLENLGPDPDRFTEGVSTTISDERYAYARMNDTTWSMTWLNDRGRPYQEDRHVQDRLGYPHTIDSRNLITQRRSRITFGYDAHGRLAERTEQSDLASPSTTTWTWTYDMAGNPLVRDQFRDGRLVRHSEFLYADGSLFLKAVITRNEESGLIEVLRYETER